MKILFAILTTTSLFLLVCSGNLGQSNWYIFLVRTFFLMSSIIPISMKVNVDFAKLYYSYQINHDRQMPGTSTRNSSIPEELGRIQYLLTDKTGTLTRNHMILKKVITPWITFTSKNLD